ISRQIPVARVLCSGSESRTWLRLRGQAAPFHFLPLPTRISLLHRSIRPRPQPDGIRSTGCALLYSFASTRRKRLAPACWKSPTVQAPQAEQTLRTPRIQPYVSQRRSCFFFSSFFVFDLHSNLSGNCDEKWSKRLVNRPSESGKG